MQMITSMTMVDRIIGSAPFVYEGDFVAGVGKARALGYDGVELHIANPQEVDADALQQALSEQHMRLTAIGTGRAYVNEGLSLSDPDSERRRAAVQRVEDFISLAGKFGAIVIIGCMRGNVDDPDNLPKTLEYLAESMKYLDQVAAQQSVYMVFEPINRYENNFLCSIQEVLQFVDSCQLKNTGVLIDTFHMNIEETDMLQAIAQCGDKLKYVHFSDSNRYYPGAGHTDMQAILHQLNVCSYCGTLSSEILPRPTKEEAAKGWIEAVTRMMEAERKQSDRTE